ncbi:MAG TPA: polysaccharide biosynthesis/export family protein [Caulobacteraceae bacterium]|nr:polysaccharide biosynthesis/export family protein [Caulobacteraceae bacterium]
MRFFISILVVSVMFSAIAAGGCAVAQAASTTVAEAPASSADSDYVLGPADVIEVSVLGRADFRARARINEAGTIELPYLGAVVAANKTTTQFADDVAAALEHGGFFEKPVVSVQIVSYASRYVTVLGQVDRPGLIPVDRPYHLSEILARVGGVKETGADYLVLVDPDGRTRRLDVTKLSTGDPSQDPMIAPGDRIFSPRAPLFYVNGQVRAPGTFPLQPEGLTVRMAIARAGGVSEQGSMGKVSVTHPGAPRAVKESLDAKVEPGDIINVGTRLF